MEMWLGRQVTKRRKGSRFFVSFWMDDTLALRALSKSQCSVRVEKPFLSSTILGYAGDNGSTVPTLHHCHCHWSEIPAIAGKWDKYHPILCHHIPDIHDTMEEKEKRLQRKPKIGRKKKKQRLVPSIRPSQSPRLFLCDHIRVRDLFFFGRLEDNSPRIRKIAHSYHAVAPHLLFSL